MKQLIHATTKKLIFTQELHYAVCDVLLDNDNFGGWSTSSEFFCEKHIIKTVKKENDS